MKMRSYAVIKLNLGEKHISGLVRCSTLYFPLSKHNDLDARSIQWRREVLEEVIVDLLSREEFKPYVRSTYGDNSNEQEWMHTHVRRGSDSTDLNFLKSLHPGMREGVQTPALYHLDVMFSFPRRLIRFVLNST